MARTFNSILNKIVKEDIPVLFLISGGKLLVFGVECDVGCRFLIYGLYYVEECSSIPILLSIFIISGCCTLSNAFSASIDMVM